MNIDSLQYLQDEPNLQTGQKSALQQWLFWRYANGFQINAHHTYLHD